jgi:hypothetical protein
MELKTIYTSNIPVECYIIKGRLESEGLDCFIFDDNIIWVNPFRAVAVGGVKLKVPVDQVELAEMIMSFIEQDKLMDEHGEYEMSAVFENEIIRQNEILDIKTQVRKNTSLIENPNEIKTEYLNHDEIHQLLESEKKFNEFANTKFTFKWEQFLFELFDFDRDVFKYFRIRPVEYYLDKELVDNYNYKSINKSTTLCRYCKSDEVSYSYTLDIKWGIIYILLLALVSVPFPMIVRNHHCFNCGSDFN